MHSSDEDEDDFLSADEEGFGDEEGGLLEKTSESKAAKQSNDKTALDNEETRQRAKPAEAVAVIKEQKEECKIKAKEEKVSGKIVEGGSAPDEVGKSEIVAEISKQSSNSVAEDEDEEEDEALADRIRERNLKIARKFSAEIAKNIKASAPVPVKPSAVNIGFKNSDIEYPNIPDSLGAKIGLPPAPPPTPALSSSFNNLDEQSTSTSASSPTLTQTPPSQYGWRILPKIVPTPTTQASGLSSKGSAQQAPGSTSEQTRSALDRLSESVSHSDKNLFERVAADLKKVSIRSEDPPVPQQSGGVLPTNPVPLIADLGSTLGGWGWSGATKLLSSASHVSSQVTSVLDSVVNVVPQHTQRVQAQDSGGSTAAENQHQQRQQQQLQKAKQSSESSIDNATTSTSDQKTDDAFMGFTLNAMESIGKKAFNVMTTRDETGSLQLKGLGRPWEHLINLKKSYEQFELEEEESVERNAEQDLRENTGTVIKSKPRGDESTLPASLKSRKRRQDYDDKLD